MFICNFLSIDIVFSSVIYHRNIHHFVWIMMESFPCFYFSIGLDSLIKINSATERSYVLMCPNSQSITYAVRLFLWDSKYIYVLILIYTCIYILEFRWNLLFFLLIFAIRISRIRKPIFHVRTDTEKSRSWYPKSMGMPKKSLVYPGEYELPQ